MKKLLAIYIFLLTNCLFACVCAPKSLLDLTAKADFIATVKILSINKDAVDEDVHNIKVEILELFKGQKVNSLKLNSRLNSSCGFYTPENTNWLIFAYKGEDGRLSFGYCSGAETMDDKFDSEIYYRKYSKSELDKLNATYLNKIKSKIRVLRYLKNNNIQPTNEFNLTIYFVSDCLKELKGFSVENEPFALYELVINKDLKLEKIKILREFDSQALSAELIQCITEGTTILSSNNETELSNKTKLVLGLYFYPAKGKRKSFIAKYAF